MRSTWWSGIFFAGISIRGKIELASRCIQIVWAIATAPYFRVDLFQRFWVYHTSGSSIYINQWTIRFQVLKKELQNVMRILIIGAYFCQLNILYLMKWPSHSSSLGLWVGCGTMVGHLKRLHDMRGRKFIALHHGVCTHACLQSSKLSILSPTQFWSIHWDSLQILDVGPDQSPEWRMISNLM